jgi:bifunctional UDP-N-acetylglucosamine pyrophosphorylase/glucosamine-1-phosphate N-acetyltransferase
LRGIIDEIVIIVGFKKEMIIDFVEKNRKRILGNVKIKFVEQEEQLGTGHAVMLAKEHVKGKFLVMNGDDVYSGKDIKNLVKCEIGVLGKEVENPSSFGIFTVDKKDNLLDLVEKPVESRGNLANTGAYVFDESVFEKINDVKKSERGEIELTDALLAVAKEKGCKVVKVKDYWLPIGYPWDLLKANEFFLGKLNKSLIKGKIEKGVHIKGKIILGKGSQILGGSYIEGPVAIGENTTIGPLAHLRPNTSIGNNCNIGKTELFDAIIMDNTVSKHQCYIGHSIIGENVNVGAGLVTADYRHDAKEHVTIVNGKKVETGRRKLGAFIGDNVKIGINTSIYPGRKIWPNMMTRPGEVVEKDLF